MTAERPGPPQSVPTLTEVISWPEAARPTHDDARESADSRAGDDAGPRDTEARGQPVQSAEAPPMAKVPTAEPPPVSPQGAHEPSAVAHASEPGSTSVGVDEDALARRVLLDLQRQLDGVLEYRVREVLTPILERAADALVRDARRELSRSLADLVDRAVAEQLRRQRPG